MSEEPHEIKRWPARCKAEVVTEIIKGKEKDLKYQNPE
jgi:hypothetical protein